MLQELYVFPMCYENLFRIGIHDYITSRLKTM